MSVPPRSTFWDVASLPFTMGGMGLHSAVLTSGAAYWSSWGDCLEMIAARNPSVADMIVTQIDHEDAGFHVSGAAQVRDQFVRAGFDVPNWQALRAGLRPPGQQVDERQVGIPGHGWQHETTQAVHAHFDGHDHLAATGTRRTSLDPVARRSHVRGPFHVFSQ